MRTGPDHHQTEAPNILPLALEPEASSPALCLARSPALSPHPHTSSTAARVASPVCVRSQAIHHRSPASHGGAASPARPQRPLALSSPTPETTGPTIRET